MIVLICKNVLKKDKIEEVKEYYKELVRYTRKQKGCIFYDVYQSDSTEESLIFVERWAGEDDLDEHLNDPVYLKMFEKIEKHLVKDEVVHMYHDFI